jgi:glutamate dehydrogenase
MDSGEARFSATSEEFLARAVAGPYPAFKKGAALAPAARAFLQDMFDDAGPDELAGLSVDDLLMLAHDFWAWHKATPEGGVRLRPGVGAGGARLARDVLEILGADMPFLVDSAMGELSEQGLSAMAMFHPITADGPASAPRVSMIQIHLKPLPELRGAALVDAMRATIADVHASVKDFSAMKQKMEACAESLTAAKSGVDAGEIFEAAALLRWLAADRFTFLGARDYGYARDAKGAFTNEEPEILEETGLGLLRDPERYVLRRSAEPFMLTHEVQRLVADKTPLIVAKSTLRSRVHRRTAADYIGVKRYDARGAVVGETRFVGLFTADAYNEMTRDIPVLRRKVKGVMAQAGFSPGSHNEKTLANVLETYPRDELWQTELDDLARISRGILHLIDRPKPRVFVRRDRFNRFVSALVYLPKDRFNTALREAVGARLGAAFGGEVESFFPTLSDGPLARVQFTIANIDRSRPDPDMRALEAEIVALTLTWEDALDVALSEAEGLQDAEKEMIRVRSHGAFNAAYRERFNVSEALTDLTAIVRASDTVPVHVRAYRNAADAAHVLRCKIYSAGDTLALSSALPILENMGLFVQAELGFPVRLAAFGDRTKVCVYVHDIEMRSANGQPIDFSAVERSFEEAFAAIWTGQAENDGFNRLILALGVRWREAALIRALCRYRQQSGLDPSQGVQEAALADHPDLTAQLLALFRVRFDPRLPDPVPARTDWAAQVMAKIETGLNAVVSLDADRVLRRLAKLIMAVTRTNFYQPAEDGAPKAYMSFKIASQALEDLPQPKPYREIWVAGPAVEGVHFRFGKVARGGLRWSDRRDDFRTEVLDLVKAQQVKNAIIVPVGAKGGFFPKNLPPREQREAYQAAGIAAYKTFLRGLLDITDNITADGVKPPGNVVRWDEDDPYLVVAADKGTATFSDIANGISAEYGHWLGDAFASGGAQGYDHKGMGITAKGAWEAVKRHFREMGKDIQVEPFTVVGVGDMSGDVFGNGMLLSRQIRLLAAFDHRDIFIDPNPDIQRSFVERERLFKLERSSWQDYDQALISPGGGLFSRSMKAISLTREIQDLTGLRGPTVTPSELMAALLKADVELLWFGGIGTFVKARSETDAQAGDKANDAHRVNGEDLRARVVGEGANLGLTQAGRVAFARHGGRINTDAVDNSAGVDTSDHEVNIKILLADAMLTAGLKEDARNALLASMTDDVSKLVLTHNYDQTLALTLAQASAASDIDSHERFIERLEGAGKLSRAVEGLPSAEDIRALREAGLGLTRPELAKLIAYAKIDLFDALVASAVPDDPHFGATLTAYFPPALGQYSTQMNRHRLRREIISTRMADALINFGGPTFIDRVRDTVRAEPVKVAAAFEAARHIYRFDALADRINGLDTQVPAAAQTALHQDITVALRRVVAYLARRSGPAGEALPIGGTIAAYQAAVDQQMAAADNSLTARELESVKARQAILEAAGAPAALARDVALLQVMVAALDVADLAAKAQWPVITAARLYRAVGSVFGLDRLRAAAGAFRLAEHWDRLAVRRTVEEIFEDQRSLAEAAIVSIGSVPAEGDQAWADQAARAWMEGLGPQAVLARATFAELEAHGSWTFAKLMIAAAEFNGLAKGIRR